ncbi:hypothetical protein C3747_41g1323c [Trypanosoma cruzi]|uniref:Uncharacterized protein n=2 Tax=Trypanosoma cruzi TaxID=5693 RepID=Q4E0U7_TRYCC|nr:hypothetical protein, conserved [Trypanosoma cruzi]PBJ80732.1 hypothetical protein BCY84_00929 [Trypanosoma cruzi cruzi]EAN98405.1 hypothetical protein, conserved [Trypanosoma cruzi]KAF8286079.1 hypothetical protein TcBrA4_0029880 [Trypanosoma cruzi]KAF8295111.1 hypothetical protein TcYC6_0096120 [Trypanosoma cruzi]PWU91702.1 hypothetical protein C4B63_42g567c [Trypanosoma cruzi]|eukprot:XP_820256.1 hypothetical protein [Trypanosoma cruzi strain CL Brener]
MTSIALWVTRRIRTFDLKHSCRTRPYAWYFSLCLLFVSWANYAQYRRLRPMYPNYEEYRLKEGGRMLEAKRQEMADVMRYNSMVSTMRSELSGRG